MTDIATSQMITPQEAARHYGVDERTVRNWINRGILPAKRRGTGPRGRLFIDKADLDKIYKDPS